MKDTVKAQHTRGKWSLIVVNEFHTVVVGPFGNREKLDECIAAYVAIGYIVIE